MSTKKSATSEALAIPEIISSIFDAVCCEPRWKHFRTLLSCTLVGSIWHDEANRRLWDHCGENTDVFNIPTLENLLNLDISTRQKFANYIRCIYIDNASLPDGTPRWEGWRFPKLVDLSFHRLQELYIFAPYADDPEPYQTPALTQFAQPDLRKVQIYGTFAHTSFGITEEWIEALTKRSRDLRHFHYVGHNDDPKFSISPTTFLSFIESMHSLESLEWELSGMSEAAFITVARSTSLRHLGLAEIADEWVQNEIRSSSPGILFRNLAELDCCVSPNGLDHLVHHLTGLTTLSLRITHDTTRALKTLRRCTFKSLKELRLESLSNDIVQGTDLLALVSKLPQLSVLDVAWGSEGIDKGLPLVQNISNNVMEDLAASLPKLRELRLISSDNTDLTEKSLVSLGKHCPDLSTCKVSAIVDFNNLVNEEESVVWKNLSTLEIRGLGMQPDDEEEDVIAELAKKVRKLMPSLESAVINLNWDLEAALNNLISEEWA